MIKRNDITNEINRLEEECMKISLELEKLKKRVPVGARLRASKIGKGYQYFIRKQDGRINGEYIKKKDRQVAGFLAQIEYDEKLIEELQKKIESLKLLQTACEDPCEIAMGRMVLGKRELVDPHHISDEAFITQWRRQEYTGLEFDEKAPEYYTRRGLRVRSKSEIIIADTLDDMSIPFLYEKPLHLDEGIVHPDFTLLNIRERKEVYWEHFGIMDDMDYRNGAFRKIRQYESNGFYRYDSFIWTEETGRCPLNMKSLRKMVGKMKEKLGYSED